MAERSSTVDQPTAPDLRDERGGTRDPVTPPSPHPEQPHPTEHEAAQHGADVRPETEQANERTPEGLQRKPSDPMSPSVGRSPNKPSQVP